MNKNKASALALSLLIAGSSLFPSYGLLSARFGTEQSIKAVVPKKVMVKNWNFYNETLGDNQPKPFSLVHDENSIFLLQSFTRNDSPIPLDTLESIVIRWNGNSADANTVFSKLVFFEEKDDAQAFLDSGRVSQNGSIQPLPIDIEGNPALKIQRRAALNGPAGSDLVDGLQRETLSKLYVCSMPDLELAQAETLEILQFVNFIPYRNTLPNQLSTKVPGEI